MLGARCAGLNKGRGGGGGSLCRALLYLGLLDAVCAEDQRTTYITGASDLPADH